MKVTMWYKPGYWFFRNGKPGATGTLDVNKIYWWPTKKGPLNYWFGNGVPNKSHWTLYNILTKINIVTQKSLKEWKQNPSKTHPPGIPAHEFYPDLEKLWMKAKLSAAKTTVTFNVTTAKTKLLDIKQGSRIYECYECGNIYSNRLMAHNCCREGRCRHIWDHGYCDNCGEKKPKTSLKSLGSQFTTQGIRRKKLVEKRARSLTQTVADFYLLECLSEIENMPLAKGKLKAFEKEVAKEFSNYLDEAIGGELRHAQSHSDVEDGKELAHWLEKISGRGRKTGAASWNSLRKKYGIKPLHIAHSIFMDESWEGGYGGESWGNIAKVLLSYLDGPLNDRLFIDRCFSLEHNGGCVFDKQYDTDEKDNIPAGIKWKNRNYNNNSKIYKYWYKDDASYIMTLPLVLEAHGQDDYSMLFRYASDEVKKLWKIWEHSKRKDRSAEWLGQQYTLTESEVEKWENELKK